jgi:hypothetical protein
MKTLGMIVLTVFFLSLGSCLSYSQSSDKSTSNINVESGQASMLWDTATEGKEVTVSGKVRRLGSDPFSFLVITDNDEKDWYLDEAGSLLLMPYEQMNVGVAGVVEMMEMILANGKSLGFRRILTQVTICSL